MQFAVLIMRDESRDHEFDWERLSAEYAKYAKELADAGVARAGAKLAPSGTATTIRTGQIVTDGPYSESREHLGGYFIVECASQAEAVEWARRCPGVEHGVVEVRAVVES